MFVVGEPPCVCSGVRHHVFVVGDIAAFLVFCSVGASMAGMSQVLQCHLVSLLSSTHTPASASRDSSLVRQPSLVPQLDVVAQQQTVYLIYCCLTQLVKVLSTLSTHEILKPTYILYCSLQYTSSDFSHWHRTNESLC